MIGEPRPTLSPYQGVGSNTPWETGFNTIQRFQPSSGSGGTGRTSITAELIEPYKTLLEKAAKVLISVLDGDVDLDPMQVQVARFILDRVANQPPPVITYRD